MKTTTEKPPAANPLENLATQADNMAPPLGEGVTDADVAERQAQEQARPSNAQLLAGMFTLARDTVTQLADVQSIQTTLGPPQIEQLGSLWGQVLDGYGITLDAYMGKHGALIAATLATIAIGVNVRAGYRAEQAARADKNPTPAPGPLPVVPAE